MSGKPPITRHPLFPATVALWFGALFGIGSLAMRPALIEAAITAIKLDAIIAVPIGPTTRILIALALAGAGGLLGARLARRVGRPKPVARPRKRGADFTAREAKAPAQPAAAEAPASPLARGARRTQLAIPDDGHGEVTYYDRAPVPGSAQILDVSQFGLEGFEPEKDQAASQDSGPDLFAEPETHQEAAFLPGPAYDEALETHREEPAEAADEPAFSQSVPELPVAENPPASPVLPRFTSEEEPAVPPTTRPRFDRTPPAPGLFTQPFNARVSEIRWQDGIQDDLAGHEAQPAPGDLTDAPAAQPHGDASAAERIASARLDDLAPIELLERLAISLREKRDRAALAAHPLPPASGPDTPVVGEDIHTPPAEMMLDHTDEPEDEDEEDEPEARASTPVAPPVPTIPAGLQPIGLDPEDDEDDLPSFIPPRRIGGTGQTYSAPVTPPAAPSQAPDTGETSLAEALEPELENGYSSLLNLSRPASQTQAPAQRFVRIEEPEPLTAEIEPVVVFPGQMAQAASAPSRLDGNIAPPIDGTATESAPHGPDSEETERALRSALANIQRMSGAA